MTEALPNTARPSLREAQKQMTRQRVVESALAVFADKGFTAATMDDIAGQAGMSRGTIYLHFDNKTEILRAAVAQLPQLMPLLDAIFAARTREARHAGFAALDAYWREHLAAVWVHVREAAAVDAQTDAWVQRIVRDQTAMIQTEFERCGVAHPASEARAFMIMSMWHEYLYRIGGAARHLAPEDSVEAMTDLFEAAAIPGAARA